MIQKVHSVLEKLSEVESPTHSFSREIPPSNFEPKMTFQPELPGGQVDLASLFYIERPAIEARAYEEIAKPGSLIRIKAPWQMGKSSLMARLMRHSETLGCRSVLVNFELADSEVFSDLNEFLQWFCATVTDDLQLPIELDERWSKYLGSKKNCTNYFEKYLLPKINTPLVLALDEVDRIFPHEKIADDFFGLLRAWHEKAKQSEIWKNFRLIIIHGTEVYIPLSNDQSPFNVGLPIELSEFEAHQVHDLAQRHGLDFSPNQVEQLMAMVGGHPHLVRLALYKIACCDITLEQILAEAPTQTGIYADHLRLHLSNLEKYPELAQALKQVVESDTPVQVQSALAFKLNSMGLVKLQGNEVSIGCDLYRQYFRDRTQSSRNHQPLSLASERLKGPVCSLPEFNTRPRCLPKTALHRF
ncbi:MAG: molecular chaperone Tir [Moorea sp. SIO2B7]|nr:molecular chaperone Tir [Moorena sp. SIO2B7]